MIYINNILWNIFIINNNDIRLKKSNNDYSIGVCDYNDKCIYISNMVKGKFLEKVITHEICHAYCMSYNITMDLNTEELICDFIATWGRDVIKSADEVFGILIKVA